MSMEFEPCTDEYLTMLWEHIDLKAAEEKLADLQYQLTRAAYRKDGAAIEELQNTIVRDLDIKCLAVRHVVGSSSSPGVDVVKWRTPAEKMRGAMSLTSKDYPPLTAAADHAGGQEHRQKAVSATAHLPRPGHAGTVRICSHPRDRSVCRAEIVCLPPRPLDPGRPRLCDRDDPRRGCPGVHLLRRCEGVLCPHPARLADRARPDGQAYPAQVPQGRHRL